MMKKKPRVLVLVDWNPDNGSLLLDCLREAGLICDLMGTDYKRSQWTPLNKVFFHWPRCLWVSIKAFSRRRDYDYVIAWPQVMGMLLGFIKLITFSNSPNVFLLNTTLVERKNPLQETLRRRFISLSLKKVNHVSFLSNDYMRFIQKRFRLSETQLVHLKQPITFGKNPDYSGFKPDSYLYSVGLSYRDFPTLMAAARKCSKQFVLATTDAFLKGLTIPDNVTVYRNTFGNDAEELMKQSAAVIFPLERTSSPAGETTLVSAMFYGKPVITTKTITTQEYIQDGQNGFLVPVQDPDAIVDAIHTLFSDPEKADEIGQRARQSVLENHTMEIYSKKIFDIIVKNCQETGTL
jgi:glycosyltransferase involved in cell wall biosynthesis